MRADPPAAPRAEPVAGRRTRPTGIAWLDEDLAPMPTIPHVAFAPDAGVDALPFLLHMAAAHAAHGGHVVAITSRAPDAWASEAQRLGLVIPPAQLETVPPDAAATAAQRTGPTDLLLVEAGADRFASRHAGPFATVIPTEKAAMTRADAVVRLRRTEVQGVRVETFHVARRAAGPPSPRAVPYRIERPGGVRPHVAKVLVTGPHNAGKSSLVHTLSQRGVSVELLGTTVAFDHGQADHDGLVVNVFGTPGQERFDPVIRQVARGAQGVIVVVDSDQPSTFVRARHLAQVTSGGVVPVVWAANKQDSGAPTTQALRERLQLPEDATLVPCVATDRGHARKVLAALLAKIMTPPREPTV